MQIRSITSSDYSKWLPLWEGYNTFYKRNLSAEVTEKTFERFLDKYEPVFCLVAENDGNLVGFTTYLFHRHTAMLSEVCYLQDLYTEEKFRGQGLGKSLIEAVYKRAKEHGSIQAYWMTHESNAVARSIYDKLAKHSGFIVYSRSI